MKTATTTEIIQIPSICELAQRYNALLVNDPGEDNPIRLLLDLQSVEVTLRTRSMLIPFLAERVKKLRLAKERLDGAFPSINFRDPFDAVAEAESFPEEDDEDLLCQVEDIVLSGHHEMAFGLRKQIESRIMALRLELDERVEQDRGISRIQTLKADTTALLAPEYVG